VLAFNYKLHLLQFYDRGVLCVLLVINISYCYQLYTTFEGWNLIELSNSSVNSVEALQQKAFSRTDTLKNAVMEFVADYCSSFNTPFMPTWTGSHDMAQDHMSIVNISSLNEPIRIKVCCVHRVGTLRLANIYIFI